jgi:hypothetical protein
VEASIEKARELTDQQQLLADSIANVGSDFVRMGLLGELSFRNLTQALRRFVADLIAAIVRMAIFNALVSYFTGGASTAAFAGFNLAGGHFGTASPGSAGGFPLSTPTLGPAIGGAALSINQGFLGVSERFVRDLNEAQARVARTYGVQIVASEALA